MARSVWDRGGEARQMGGLFRGRVRQDELRRPRSRRLAQQFRHHVQPHIDPGQEPACRQDARILDDALIGVGHDVGKLLHQGLRADPVRRHDAAVQKPGPRNQEDARADRDQRHAPFMLRHQPSGDPPAGFGIRQIGQGWRQDQRGGLGRGVGMAAEDALHRARAAPFAAPVSDMKRGAFALSCACIKGSGDAEQIGQAVNRRLLDAGIDDNPDLGRPSVMRTHCHFQPIL